MLRSKCDNLWNFYIEKVSGQEKVKALVSIRLTNKSRKPFPGGNTYHTNINSILIELAKIPVEHPDLFILDQRYSDL